MNITRTVECEHGCQTFDITSHMPVLLWLWRYERGEDHGRANGRLLVRLQDYRAKDPACHGTFEGKSRHGEYDAKDRFNGDEGHDGPCNYRTDSNTLILTMRSAFQVDKG